MKGYVLTICNSQGEYIEFIRRTPGQDTRRMSSPAIIERLSVSGPPLAGPISAAESDTTMTESVMPSVVSSPVVKPAVEVIREEGVNDEVIREG